MTEYWQIAAGSAGRNYEEWFLKFGMAFVGGEKQEAMMENVSEGDIVLLKRGLSQIVAVGEVVSRDGRYKGKSRNENLWLDFDGWELSAFCCVDWHVPEKPIKTEGLTRSTIQHVQQEEHKRLADQALLLVAREPEAKPPSSPQTIDDDEILKFLIREGLRPAAAETLTYTLRRLRLLAKYYYDEYHESNWKDVREHETRTFLIIPLLLALGWAEQQIKIELPTQSRGRVDIACFSNPYHKTEKRCTLLLEAKDFSSGLDYAPEQARRYAQSFPSCGVVVVSNGYCYKTYVRTDSGEFSITPSAYLNLLKPTDKYPLDPTNVKGAFEVLRWLLPTATLQ